MVNEQKNPVFSAQDYTAAAAAGSFPPQTRLISQEEVIQRDSTAI